MVSRFTHRLVVQATRLTAACAVMLGIVLTSPLTSQPAHAQDLDPVAAALKAKVSASPSGTHRADQTAALMAYYEGRAWQPIWFDDRGPTRAARLAAAEIARGVDFGLSENTLQLPALTAAMVNGRWSAQQTAAAEYELSAAILDYAHQARGGRIAEPDRMLSSYLDRRPRLIDPAFVLAMTLTAARPDEVLRSFHPDHDQFRKLQTAYQALRATARIDPAGELPDNRSLLLPGTRHADIRALRVRLNMPASGDAAEVYDAPLAAAVRAFQESAGLNDDGIVGQATRKALNAGPGAKLATLRANMEQWRWMPEELGTTHLFVNVPKFTITLMRNGAPALEERVITGKRDTQTPIFSKSMSTIVLRPSWKLPDSIKLEKLLSAQRNGSTIEDQGYVIKKGKSTIASSDVDWSKANLSHYEIFQPSGDGNALGNVKFLFPNKHSVYLHDTPMKSLFEESSRLFSHGCIRLKNPLSLAQILLDADKGSGRFSVKALVDKGPGANEIQLDRPIPVHVGYFTAWAESDSVVTIHPDVYGHEERITLALTEKWKEIDKGDDHLAAIDTWQLKDVRIVQRTSLPPVRRVASPKRYAPPMGLTKTLAAPVGLPPVKFFKSYKSKSDGGVGDIMRNALMNN